MSAGGAWLRLFLSPRGSIGLRTYIHGIVVVVLVNVVLMQLVVQLNASDMLLAPLATIYPTVCVLSKRLRRIGRSPWLQLAPRTLMAIGLVSISLQMNGIQSLSLGAVGVIGVMIGGVWDLSLYVWLSVKPEIPNGLEVFD